MAFSFKFPKVGGSGDTGAPMTVSADVMPAKAPVPSILAGQPVVQQMKTLGGIFVVLLLLIGVLVFRDNRESAHNTAYVAASGEMRMLSQRLAKASSLALQGNPVAFAQLRESRETFGKLLETLTSGGEVAGVGVPASPDNVRPQIDALTQLWEPTNKNAETVIGQEKNLVALGQNVATIDNNNATMLELTEQIATLKLQTGASAREIANANQLVMLTQRIAKNASALLVGDEINPEVAFLLGKDTNAFRDIQVGLSKAGGDADTRSKLEELESAFKDYQGAISSILGNMQPLVLSKQAGSRIFRGSEDLLKATDNLALAYQEGPATVACTSFSSFC
jgi:twitching motility protein PilJ